MDLDDLLAEADPMAGAVVTPLRSSAIDRLKELTVVTPLLSAPPSPPSPPVRRRSRRRAVIITSVVALAAVAVPVAALTGGIHTGFFASEADTEMVHGSELLDISHPDIVDVVREEAASVPLPPGASYDAFLARYPAAERMLEQREGLRTGVEFFAKCRWYEHWLAGDPSVRAAAAKTIATFVEWKFMQRYAPGDAGPQLTRDLIAQVQRGDETLVRQFLLANC